MFIQSRWHLVYLFIVSLLRSISLIKYIDENPLAVVDDTMEALCREFEGLRIRQTTLYRHMTTECCLSFKQARKIVERRNSTDVLLARKNWVSGWMNIDLNCFANRVFIDEAGFHTHMIRNMAWCGKGEPANVTIPTQRGNSVTILGVIHLWGVVSMTLRKPKASKKRKVPGSSVRKTVGRMQTTSRSFCAALWIFWTALT